MKINKQYLAAFLIGAIVGGVVIGIIDVKKPRPLLSSASPQQCQYLVAIYNQVVAEMNIRPVIDRAHWEELNESLDQIIEDIGTCSEPICDPIWNQIGDYRELLDHWEEQLNVLESQRDEFISINPQPWSDRLRSRFEDLQRQLFHAEDQVIRFSELLDEAFNKYYEETGCGVHDDIDSVDPLPPDTNSGSGMGNGSY